MTIGIDARMFQEGLGIGRYIEQLLKHLEQADAHNTYYIFLRRKNFDAYQPKNKQFKKIYADYPWYSCVEQIFFPILLMRYPLDCMHFPHFNVPIAYPKRYIVTIHDLIMIKFPLSASSAATTRHPYLHAIKYAAYRLVLQCAVRRAAHIIAVSNAVKNDIGAYLHVPSEKISVIFEAADTTHACVAHEQLPASVKKPYILYTGNAYPHKNLEGLLQAFVLLSRDAHPLSLVICGQEDVFFRRTVARIRELGLAGRVRHLGFVPEEILCLLYRHAAACIMPSFEEGFGLPALEAMSHGTPVIASQSTCFQEILGDAALYADPASPQSLADAMRTVAQDAALQQDLRTRGMRQASRYTWKRTAEQTRMIYETHT